MNTPAEVVTLEVNRSDYAQTRLHRSEVPELAEGEVRLKVSHFAITANTITYAVIGDMLDYWGFFPTDEGWGRVPAIGFGEVTESHVDGVEVGQRFFGWFPQSNQVSFRATATKAGFRDDGEHRQPHAATYRQYTEASRDPLYGDDMAASFFEGEKRHALLRPLFMTGFLADAFFRDAPNGEHYFGAGRTIVLSASSKTAIAYTHQAKAGGVETIGLTSARNRSMVASLGIYDQVFTYDELNKITADPTVVIDMAGNGEVIAALHDHLGDDIRHSMIVGMSHHDAPRVEVTSGPTPELFFAPSEVERRMDAWGADGYWTRLGEATIGFVDSSRSWLSVDSRHGSAAAKQTWDDVYTGQIPPSVGVCVSLE